MSEFIVKIEDEIVQALGKQAIEQYLQAFISQKILKAAAIDILKDYEQEDFTQEETWRIAQRKAFSNDRYSECIKVYANVWLCDWYKCANEYAHQW